MRTAIVLLFAVAELSVADVPAAAPLTPQPCIRYAPAPQLALTWPGPEDDHPVTVIHGVGAALKCPDDTWVQITACLQLLSDGGWTDLSCMTGDPFFVTAFTRGSRGRHLSWDVPCSATGPMRTHVTGGEGLEPFEWDSPSAAIACPAGPEPEPEPEPGPVPDPVPDPLPDPVPDPVPPEPSPVPDPTPQEDPAPTTPSAAADPVVPAGAPSIPPPMALAAPGRPGRQNGIGADPDAELTVRFAANGRTTVRGRAGARYAVRGRLSDRYATGIRGARIDVHLLLAGRRPRLASRPRTGRDGRFRLDLPSDEIRAARGWRSYRLATPRGRPVP